MECVREKVKSKANIFELKIIIARIVKVRYKNNECTLNY